MNNKPHSEEAKRKMSESHKGNTARLGKKSPHTQEAKDKISKNSAKFWKGKHFSEEHKAKLRANHRKKNSIESRLKSSKTHFAKRELNHLWKGGVHPENLRIRKGVEYKLWREAVFTRDNWTCVWCGARCGKGNPIYLEADHIKPFAYFPELRFAIDNGRTLCEDCHKTTETYAKNLKNSKSKYGKRNTIDKSITS